MYTSLGKCLKQARTSSEKCDCYSGVGDMLHNVPNPFCIEAIAAQKAASKGKQVYCRV